MEADLLPIYGNTLPENWREARVPSFRRLLVIVRHLPADSAVGRALGLAWPVELELLDDIRRASMHAIKGNTDPHPDRPAGKALAAEKAAKAAKREHAREAARDREAQRQDRLRARAEGGDT